VPVYKFINIQTDYSPLTIHHSQTFDYIYSLLNHAMKSIFNATDNAEFIDRIDKLSPSSQALWGKMNVSQMLAHCQVVIQVALGELQLKRNLLGFLFGTMAKKQILEKPLKQNLPTFSEAKITDAKNFDKEKQKLIELIKRFSAGPSVISKDPHPFFGPLTIDEWNTLQVKHLDHHLRQFGV
jgi:hypothetical protein